MQVCVRVCDVRRHWMYRLRRSRIATSRAITNTRVETRDRHHQRQRGSESREGWYTRCASLRIICEGTRRVYTSTNERISRDFGTGDNGEHSFVLTSDSLNLSSLCMLRTHAYICVYMLCI